MKLFRRLRLVVIPACFCVISICPALPSQQPPAGQPPAQPQTQTPSPTPPKPSPFETIPAEQQPTPPPAPPAAPVAPPAAQPGPLPQWETPKQEAAPAPNPNGQVIEAFEFRGAKRVPQDTLKALIVSKPGDLYNEETLRRDFITLWNTGRFDDVRLEAEPGRLGLIVRFVVTERRVIRSIEYPGAKSVTVSEILDRFKERKVGLSVESQYDPNKVQRAAVVLKEFLAERGRQYATVDPQIEQIPPSSLKVSFVVNEGPKVKVGHIEITGNTAKDDLWVVRNMKNSKGIGIPHSIYFESIFPAPFDRAKLDEDKERVRQAYQDAGYFQAKTLEESIDIQHRGGRGWRLPIVKMNLPGITADITLPVEEGKLYHLRNMSFTGVKLFRTPEVLMKPLFGMTTGDIFSTDKLRKGIENMRKLYGKFGYIDFVPEPDFHPAEDGTDQIDLTLTADEGKQFFIRRIDFSGNTTTRDKVIRREILLDEGDMFNTELWDYSVLRLNQLGYFEMLKKDEAADIKRNPQRSEERRVGKGSG